MSVPMDPQPGAVQWMVEDLVFLGFNSRIAALDRLTGQEIWKWKSPEGTGYVALMLDGDRLVASVNGYTYCLDPLTGVELWRNTLAGMGVGVPSLASVRGSTHLSAAAYLAAQQQQHAAAAGAHGGATG